MVRPSFVALTCLLTIAAGLLVVAPADAQDEAMMPEPEPAEVGSVDPWQVAGPAPEWGTTDATVVSVAAKAFQPRNTSTVLDTYWSNGVTYIQSTLNYLYASVSPPLGALITGVGFDGYDSDAAENIAWGIRVSYPGGSDTSIGWFASSQSGGWFSGYSSVTSHQVAAGNYYFLVTDLKKTGQDMRIRGMRLYYRLQVSPAPGAATFSDVPTGHPFFQYVEALADSGITAGCGGGSYCPDQAVTRGQMAVFLAKALGLHWPG